MKYVLVLFFVLGMGVVLSAQEMSAKELLKKSEAYHDSKGNMMKSRLTLVLNEPRPGGADRISRVTFDPKKDFFAVDRKDGEDKIYMEVVKGEVKLMVNDSEEIDEAYKQEKRLSKDRVLIMKNYYHYLWFMPMKLNDAGSIIDDKVERVDYFGDELLQIRVSYDPAIGNDVWYFYFHPETYALSGYRFYHDESKNDGEYILFEGEVEAKGYRIPAVRKWYMHVDGKYLGKDILVGIE